MRKRKATKKEHELSSEREIKFERRMIIHGWPPQQNVVAERAFATLYGRVRAMSNRAGLKGTIREKLWAQCAMTAKLLEGILSNKVGTKRKW